MTSGRHVNARTLGAFGLGGTDPGRAVGGNASCGAACGPAIDDWHTAVRAGHQLERNAARRGSSPATEAVEWLGDMAVKPAADDLADRAEREHPPCGRSYLTEFEPIIHWRKGSWVK